MAFIDYGAIAFKNGKLISTEVFTPMKQMVGWEDDYYDTYRDYYTNKDKPLELKDNFFAYVGDSEWTLAFYKESMVVVHRWGDKEFGRFHELFNNNYTWSKWKMMTYTKEEYSEIKVTKRNGYYVCKWKYKGDKYKVYFGYGVDLGYYKKWKMVNYYRSPAYRMLHLKRWFENIIYDLKYHIFRR